MVVVDKIQFLTACWTVGFNPVLAVGQGLPSVPRHVGLSIGQLTRWQLASSERPRRRYCEYLGQVEDADL